MKQFERENLTQVDTLSEASRNSAPIPESGSVWQAPRTWLMFIPLALIVAYAFIPVLDNGFVSWDDFVNLRDNPYFRGLGAAQLKWAWCTSLLGVYQPLAWLLFEAQFAACQLDPKGYHVASLLLQVTNTLVLYVLTVTLLVRCNSVSCLESSWRCCLSAALATALFAVHPLRVEAVAWASCQPYLPCALFSMLSVLAYLHAFSKNSSSRWGWLVVSLLLFTMALLFHPVPVSLPAILLILDVYPLQRIQNTRERSFSKSVSGALFEKIPFVATSLVFMGVAIAVRVQSPFGTERYIVSEGIAQACFAIWFYIRKTALPFDLIAVYQLTKNLNWLAFPYNASILATLALTTALVFVRRRWPALLAAWLIYLALLLPNSGLIRNNSTYIVADRYSYIAMLGFVVLMAAGFCRIWRISSRSRPGAIAIVAIALGALWGLTSLTWNQCRTWVDGYTLWAHALAHGGNTSAMAHNNLGNILDHHGLLDAALAHYTAAVRFDPDYFEAHYNLGTGFYRRQRYGEAEAHLTRALRLSPGHAEAHNNLGAVLSRQGRYAEAEVHFAEALRLSPGVVATHLNLGRVLAGQGKHSQATVQFTEVLRIDPKIADAHAKLGLSLARMGDFEAAKAHFSEALRLQPSDPKRYNACAILMATCPDPKFRDGKEAVRLATHACELANGNNPDFLDTLAAAQAEAGDFEEAVKTQTSAIELLLDTGQKDDFRSRLALYQAKKPYRQVSPWRGGSDPRP